MFGIIADLLTTITTVLFPIFASYKALRTGDPAQLAPWLMYWIVLSIAATVEGFFSFILTWVPFYSWFRLFLHLYLVMPGQQGATALYQIYIDPFLATHETEIEEFISSSHERARKVGLEYFKRAVAWARVNALGQPPKPPTPPPSRQSSYAQQLLSRFNLPSARDGLGAPAAGDVYSMLAAALQSVTAGSATTSREAQVEDLSASGTLIPPGVDTPEERMNYVTRQRENLRVLLQAFDREAYNLAGQDQGRSRSHGHGHSHSSHSHGHGYGHDRRPHSPSAASHLSKSRSEVDFERIESDEAPEGSGRAGRTSQGGWMPWNWSGSGGGGEQEDAGRSSGYDRGY